MTRTIIKRLAVVAVLVAVIALFRTLPVGEWLSDVEGWAAHHPVAGAVLYLALTTLAAVALTPGWIPMMLAGLVFGLMPGLIYGLIGTVAGATAAMLAGRTLARGWVEKRIAGNNRLLALDEVLDEKAFMIVALTRVALVIPFNLLNYAYGLTRVNTRTYALATAVGMLPIVALYGYLGTLAGDMGQILAGETQAGLGNAWVVGIAAFVIIVVVVFVGRAVNRELDSRMPVSDRKESHPELRAGKT